MLILLSLGYKRGYIDLVRFLKKYLTNILDSKPPVEMLNMKNSAVILTIFDVQYSINYDIYFNLVNLIW